MLNNTVTDSQENPRLEGLSTRKKGWLASFCVWCLLIVNNPLSFFSEFMTFAGEAVTLALAVASLVIGIVPRSQSVESAQQILGIALGAFATLNKVITKSEIRFRNRQSLELTYGRMTSSGAERQLFVELQKQVDNGLAALDLDGRLQVMKNAKELVIKKLSLITFGGDESEGKIIKDEFFRRWIHPCRVLICSKLIIIGKVDFLQKTAMVEHNARTYLNAFLHGEGDALLEILDILTDELDTNAKISMCVDLSNRENLDLFKITAEMFPMTAGRRVNKLLEEQAKEGFSYPLGARMKLLNDVKENLLKRINNVLSGLDTVTPGASTDYHKDLASVKQALITRWIPRVEAFIQSGTSIEDTEEFVKRTKIANHTKDRYTRIFLEEGGKLLELLLENLETSRPLETKLFQCLKESQNHNTLTVRLLKDDLPHVIVHGEKLMLYDELMARINTADVDATIKTNVLECFKISADTESFFAKVYDSSSKDEVRKLLNQLGHRELRAMDSRKKSQLTDA